MSDEQEEVYARCMDCGDEIEEGEVYGEWDDLCKCCYNQRELEGRGT